MTIVVLKIILKKQQALNNPKSLNIFRDFFCHIKNFRFILFPLFGFFSQFLVRKELKKNSQSFYQFPIFEFN